MKLVSWNVNGLRSAEQQFLEFINDSGPDILMLQELRAFEDQLSFFLKSIPGYKAVFNPSDRPGYSGTALYYKDSINIQLDQGSSPDPILNQEGRMIESRVGDTVILNFYTPNGNSSAERLAYKMKYYTTITRYVKKLLNENKSVIVGGDLNVAHTEKDLFNPKGNTHMSGFLKKERDWFSEILKLGLKDSFRMFEKQGGHYSWWSMRDPKRLENKGWRFDYFLVSKNLENRVKSAEILKDVFGSDHCPILLEINI